MKIVCSSSSLHTYILCVLYSPRGAEIAVLVCPMPGQLNIVQISDLENQAPLPCDYCTGLDDHSPEEVRWKAYEAQAAGQSDGYVSPQ